MRILRWTSLLVAGVMLAACAPTQSGSGSAQNTENYPNRAIEFVVPFAAGGSTDIAARLLADRLSKEFDQPVNVVNKPGADQISGVKSVFTSAPDGYTLLVDGAGSSSLQALLDNLPYEWDGRRFVARALVGPHAYAVGTDSQASSLKDLVEQIKKDPSGFKIAWLGGTSTSDFALLQLLVRAGIDPNALKRVPFQSSGEAMQAAAAGDVDLAVGGVSSTFALADSGDLQVLAVTGDDRVSQLPDVPTTKEAGMPKLDIRYWAGVSAPDDLPDEVAATLAEAVTKVVQQEEFAKKAKDISMTPDVLTGEEFGSYVQEEAKKFAKLDDKLAGKG